MSPLVHDIHTIATSQFLDGVLEWRLGVIDGVVRTGRNRECELLVTAGCCDDRRTHRLGHLATRR